MNTGTPLQPPANAAITAGNATDYPPIHELLTPGLWHQWAVQHSERHQFGRAVEFFRHAIVLAPTDPLLRFDLGVALFKAALLEDAHASFSEALRLDPRCKEAQQIEAALAADAGLLSPTPPHRDVQRPPLGILYCPNSDLRNDVSACIELVAAVDRLYPLHLANANFIALAGSHLTNAALLVAVARRLVGVWGNWPSKAAQWMTIDVGRAAKDLALRAVRQSPEFECLLTAAAVLRLIGEHRHALVLLERASGDKRDDPRAITLQAEIMLELGDAEAAVRLLSATIDGKSAQGQQRLTRATSGITSQDSCAEIAEIQSLLSATNLTAQERSLLHSTLGWRFGQVGRIDDAFAAFASASREKKTSFLADHPHPENPIARADKTVLEYDRNFFESRNGWGVTSRRPLFIVGMPRSGTTLVEQILARHQQIFAAGELHDIAVIGRTFWKQGAGPPRRLQAIAPYPAFLKHLSLPESKRIGARHIAALSSLDRRATYVIDKMPTNFQSLGLIALLFPNARVIHCTRHLIDTCASCYKQNLMWPFFDLHALADYALSYQQLMSHWKKTLPLEILDVSYEQVVDDLAGQAKRMLDFLDLAWTADCLTYFQSPHGIRTPSHSQVRRPVYSSSVGAWQTCRAHIEPLINRLLESPADCLAQSAHQPMAHL